MTMAVTMSECTAIACTVSSSLISQSSIGMSVSSTISTMSTMSSYRSSVMATVVTAIPAVQHAEVCASYRAIVVAVVIVVAMATVQVPGMSTSVGGIECRTSEVEVVAMRIAGIDAEVPVACAPV